MSRALLGLLKGALIGGAIGFALFKLGNPSGIFAYLFAALVGALVGVVCGKAPWKAATLWTPALKMAFGAAIGTGLYAVGHRFMPPLSLRIDGVVNGISLQSGVALVPIVGALYGLFVEFDDGGSEGSSQGETNRPASKEVRNLK